MLAGVLLIISLDLIHGSGLKVTTDVTDSQYGSVPTIFRLDDFDSCLALNDPVLYCYVSIKLTPLSGKEPSVPSQIIEELNTAPRNYRHDLLRHGICMPRTCSRVSKEDYALGNGTETLWNGVSQCYSDRYKYFGLRAVVKKLHCENKKDFYEPDRVDFAFAAYIGIFLLFAVIGTLYESFSASKRQEESKKCGCIGKLLSAFSVRKNLKHLLLPPRENTEADSLAIFQGVRFVYVCFAIMAHSAMTSMSVPVLNTKFAEEITTKPGSMIFVNGGLMYQTFFLISGWLMSYRVLKNFEMEQMQFKDIVKILVLRIFRILPMLVLAVGVSATWLRHANGGPIWEHLIGADYNKCRSNSIWTLLFVNNYYKTNEMCLQQSWFLSAEMQMFALGLLILYLISRKPQHSLKIFSIFILLGMVVSFIDAYYNNLEITTRMYPEIIYSSLNGANDWLHINISGHSQIPTFVQGLLCGYYFYKFKKENRKYNHGMVVQVVLTSIFWGTSMGLIFCGYVFYQEGSTFTTLQSAIYHAVVKYLFILPVSAGMFAAVFGIGEFIKNIFTWAPLQVLGKTVFSVFLAHTIVIKMRLGVIRSPLYLSNYTLIVDGLGDVAVSIIVGTVMCLIFDLPLSRLVKAFFDREEPKKKIEAKKSHTSRCGGRADARLGGAVADFALSVMPLAVISGEDGRYGEEGQMIQVVNKQANLKSDFTQFPEIGIYEALVKQMNSKIDSATKSEKDQ